jgi:glyoxylase-like metal-dependent hydrolase (beta-lactamase superfamily II)
MVLRPFVSSILLTIVLSACGGSATAPAAKPSANASAKPVGALSSAQQGPVSVSIYSSTEANASVNSYLLLGAKDAMLIDAQLVNSEAENLAKSIRASGHELTMIYITHGHPDHFLGLEVLHREFPNAKILALQRTALAKKPLFEQYKEPLNKFFPGDVASDVVVPEVFAGDSISFEGQEFKILEFEDGEHDFATVLYSPGLRALFAADLAYHLVHPWLNNLKPDGVLAHVKALREMKDVDVYYPGHGAPMKVADLDEYEQYVLSFLDMAKTAKDGNSLIAAVNAKYPHYKTQAGLRFSSFAFMDQRNGKQKAPPAAK